jgi:hypothetical protein
MNGGTKIEVRVQTASKADRRGFCRPHKLKKKKKPPASFSVTVGLHNVKQSIFSSKTMHIGSGNHPPSYSMGATVLSRG